MTIRERMVARSEREKDLLKYGRRQERERIIKLLEEYLSAFQAPQEQLMQRRMADFITLIKGDQK
jgi:hypothetical protein